MERRTFIKSAAAYTVLTAIATSAIGKNLMSTGNQRTSLSSSTIINTYPPFTTTVKLKGKDVKVHALSTGMVATKTNFATKHGAGALAKLNIITDKHYTNFLPIWVWLIEHPDGLIVIDTGEVTDCLNPKHLEKENAFNRYTSKHIAKFSIQQQDELNYLMASINLKPEDVKLVLLTHLHLDHTDGLRFFQKQEIIVGNLEYTHPYGNMPTTYPSWFNPNKVNYKNNKVEVFNQAYPVTASEDILYITTPGHTHGHSSIILKTDEFDIIFAGDTSYYQEQVLKGELAGANVDFKATAETYKKLLAYAGTRKTIYLPSHDPNAANRLRDRAFLV